MTIMQVGTRVLRIGDKNYLCPIIYSGQNQYEKYAVIPSEDEEGFIYVGKIDEPYSERSDSISFSKAVRIKVFDIEKAIEKLKKEICTNPVEFFGRLLKYIDVPNELTRKFPRIKLHNLAM